MRSRLSSLGLLLALPLAAPAARADEAISLNQALAEAAAGNLDLRRERVNIRTATANLLAARGRFDTLLAGGLSLSQTTTPPLTATGDFVSGTANTLSYNLGASRNLETGGNVSVGITGTATSTDVAFQCSNFTGMRETCDIYTNNLALSFQHPLLRGFGAEITEANVRKARIQQDQSALNRQARASNVVRDVAVAYWELAYATQELAIRKSAVDLAEEQLRFTQAQIQVGRAAPLEAAAAERAIADRQQQVALSEQGLFFRTLDLRRLLGVRADVSFSNLAASDGPSATPHDVDMADAVRRAIENNPQLRSLRMGLKLNEIDVRTALSTLKPQLDFVGSFGSAGRKSEFLDTWGQMFSVADRTWSAGLNLSIPVENRAALGQRDAAMLAAELARIGADDLELTLRDAVLRDATQIRTASRRLELARAAVGYAGQDLEAEKARYAVGRSTNNDILLRQQALKDAQILVVRAAVDLIEGDAALAAVTGDILDEYGITLKGI